jgi:hypothetical protein
MGGKISVDSGWTYLCYPGPPRRTIGTELRAVQVTDGYNQTRDASISSRAISTMLIFSRPLATP